VDAASDFGFGAPDVFEVKASVALILGFSSPSPPEAASEAEQRRFPEFPIPGEVPEGGVKGRLEPLTPSLRSWPSGAQTAWLGGSAGVTAARGSPRPRTSRRPGRPARWSASALRDPYLKSVSSRFDLPRLHVRQRACRLSIALLPPFERGTTSSTSRGSSFLLLPHRAHLPLARLSTS
jgi:hypothetical protein